MSAAISPATSQNYGVQRVCRIWGLPRSSFYHAIHRVAVVHPAVRRGPVPPDRLLTAIQADLAASPFHGEGHRKVWARLRYGLGLVVGRNRVLRLMHENQLLSPNRHPPRPANDHDGTILTAAPDRLWGTDASMVQTVADGRAGSSPRSITSTPRSSAITSPSMAVASPHSSQSARRSAHASVASRLMSRAASPCAPITDRNTSPVTSPTRSPTWGMALSAMAYQQWPPQ